MEKGEGLLYFQSYLYQLVFDRHSFFDVLFFETFDTGFNRLGYMLIGNRQSFDTFQENIVNQVSADSKGNIAEKLTLWISAFHKRLAHVFWMIWHLDIERPSRVTQDVFKDSLGAAFPKAAVLHTIQ